MSSTCEELSSQAEQLHETVGFFKIDETGNGRLKERAPAARTASKRSRGPLKGPGTPLIHKGDSESTGGISLNMGSGKDKIDEEFEKF
jgi:methyl-accepting chemotaxis protein